MVRKVPIKQSLRQVELFPVMSLHGYERNARTHSNAQIEQVIASIKEYGWTNPILIDEKKCIIAGHARVEAAKRLDMTEVPCIVLRGLTKAQKKAYVIADNKLALNAGWDEKLLALEFADLKELGFDCTLTGFSQDEFTSILVKHDDEAQQGDPVVIAKTATLEELAPNEQEREILKGRSIKIEFSGGKDSSATAIWAKAFFPEANIELCYVDLGADFYGYQIFLRQFAEAIGLPLKVLRSSDNMIELMMVKGWPRFVGPWCHNYLHKALDDYFLQSKPEELVVMRGGRIQEKARTGKKNITRFLTIDRLKDYVFFQPLYFAAKGVGEEILKKSGLPMWEGYSYGLQRTACRICPGQNQLGYAAIKKNFPEVWSELQQLEERLGHGCWQGGGQGSFETLASKGKARFDDAGYQLKNARKKT